MRRRSFGNARRTPNGTWQARYRGPDGRTYYRSGFDSEPAAKSFLDATRVDVLRGVWVSPDAPPRPEDRRLAEYAAEWMELRRKALRLSTQAQYASSLRLHILPRLGERTLAELTPSLIRSWHSERQHATGPTAVRHAYVLLRAILNTAVQDEILVRNPCQITGAGQPKGEERPYLSRAQVEGIAAAMPTDQLRVFVMLKFWASLRLGEILALRRGDLVMRPDKDGKLVMVVRVTKARVRVGDVMVEGKPKTRESVRDVPLPRQAEVMMRAHLSTRRALPAAYLFVTDAGEPLRPHDVRRPFHRAQGALGLSGYHLLDLRHAGLTVAALSGATLGQLKSRAGHNSARMVAHYQRRADELDDRLADAMSDPETGTESGAQGG